MGVLIAIENVSIKWPLRPLCCFFTYLLPVDFRLQLIAYASNHSYHSFENINFLEGPERRRTRRAARAGHMYQRTPSDDMVPLQPQQQSPRGQGYQYTDPYAHERELYAEGG
jgi:diadenosine tetraphosphatase ApaH/serine/threonine PP2A family protein phosphatase